MISLQNVSKSYDGRKIIDNISFDVYPGETFVIMGCSGSGKSTLLRLMTGYQAPEEGNIFINSRDISKISKQELDETRKKFGMVFQYSALLDSLSIEDNVALPLREHTDYDDNLIRIIVRMKLALIGLRGFEDHLPNEISGGMRKRAGLARAIALDPNIIFYDEPTSGLDPVIGGVIDELIHDLSRQLRITSIVVTHNMASVFNIADRVAMVHQGRIIEIASPEDIKNSENKYVQQFIHGHAEGPINFLDQNADLVKEFCLLKRRCP
ncbi:MAG: ABC transporter ATP-binding protein [Candidatus Omnitrophica bacterium]|nr:ABC transporter ATP-binding protein [Candidatus Omnitrophota bacterium]